MESIALYENYSNESFYAVEEGMGMLTITPLNNQNKATQGALTITSHDTQNKVIQGTFGFDTEDSSTGKTDSFTNGEFSFHY